MSQIEEIALEYFEHLGALFSTSRTRGGCSISAVNLIQPVATPHGRNPAIGETTQWLEEAGFVNVKQVRFSTRNFNCYLIGYR